MSYKTSSMFSPFSHHNKPPIFFHNNGKQSGISHAADIYESEDFNSELQFHQRNSIDLKITDNFLKLNIITYLFVLSISILMILYSNMFTMVSPDSIQNTSISFSLHDFTVSSLKGNTTDYYSCVYDYNNCNNNCLTDIKQLHSQFGFNCIIFKDYYNYGLLLIIGYAVGGLLNLVTVISILLLLFDKISLQVSEVVMNITKFEFLIYAVIIGVYVYCCGLVGNDYIKFGVGLAICFAIITVTVINYVCVRSVFNNKLRINSRITFLDN